MLPIAIEISPYMKAKGLTPLMTNSHTSHVARRLKLGTGAPNNYDDSFRCFKFCYVKSECTVLAVIIKNILSIVDILINIMLIQS